MPDRKPAQKRPTRGHRYSPAVKAQILKDARDTTVDKAATKHGCSTWSIYDWRRQQKRATKSFAAWQK